MTKSPNIIQITTHDSGRHFGCYGHPTLHTPNIDSIAADGVKLTNCFAAVPICCASRASMLTGRYPQSHGLMDLCFSPFDWALNDDEQHITQILRAAGYRTVLFGLQHEATDLDRLSFDAGCSQHLPCDQVARNVAEFLESEASRGGPFYAQVGFFETHTPFGFGGVEPDETKGVEVPPYLLNNDAAHTAMAHFQGAVRKVDEAVGIIADSLHRNGQEDNTILVFTTDHGIEMPRAKWFLYDPGIAIAQILRYPGKGLTGGRECDLLLSNVDYLPTVLSLAELDIPDRIQGKSFALEIQEDRGRPVREAVYSMYHKTQSRSVRTDRFKLIRHFDAVTDFHKVPVRFEDVLAKRGIKRIELFDLDDDPNEFNNLAGQAEYNDIQDRLDTMLWEWMQLVEDPLLKGPIRTPSYRSAMRDYVNWQDKRD